MIKIPSGSVKSKTFEIGLQKMQDAISIPVSATIFDATALLLAALVAYLVWTTKVGSGDYGQWLMVSRYYSGQSIPDYRNIAALPPLVPIYIAGLKAVVGDPIATMTCVKISLALYFFLATYWCGTALFDSRAAGLLGATISFFVSDRALELYAFGGLLQLGSLIFLAIAMGAYGRAMHSRSLALRWWVLGGACIALAALSHAGTGSLAILAGLGVAVAGALFDPGLSWRRRAVAVGPTVLFLAMLTPYWLFVIVPDNQGYLNNVASLYYRGPEALWLRLTAYNTNVYVLYGGIAALLAGLGCLIRLRKPALAWTPYLVLILWTGAVAGFLGLTILRDTGTEYPRFIVPLLQPLALALGGAVCALLTSLEKRPSTGAQNAGILSIGAVILGLILIGPATAISYRREAHTYQMPDLAALVASLSQTDHQLPASAAILGSVSVGKWVEGITGRPGLFATPNRYSFRADEMARSLAADVILRSTFSATNGQFFLRYTDLVNGFPTSPWLAVNHRGEYIDLAQIAPYETILTSSGDATRLSLLDVKGFKTQETDAGLLTTTDYVGTLNGKSVVVSQNALLDKNNARLSMSYSVDSPQAVVLQVIVSAIQGQQPFETTLAPYSATMRFARKGGAYPELTVKPTTPDEYVLPFEGQDGKIEVSGTGTNRLQFDVTFPASTVALNPPAFLMPSEMVNKYNVGAVYLTDDSTLGRRVKRLEALGFTYKETAGGFVELVKGGSPITKAAP